MVRDYHIYNEADKEKGVQMLTFRTELRILPGNRLRQVSEEDTRIFGEKIRQREENRMMGSFLPGSSDYKVHRVTLRDAVQGWLDNTNDKAMREVVEATTWNTWGYITHWAQRLIVEPYTVDEEKGFDMKKVGEE